MQDDISAARAELQSFLQQFAWELAAARADAAFAEESLRLAEVALTLAGTERQEAKLSARVWRAWLTYVRRTAELLELTDESWEVQ